MKKKIVMELSEKSIVETIQKLEDYIKAINKGTDNAVKKATETLYKKVIDNCNANNLSRFTSSIQTSYDETKNEGRVWTDDLVIIINEFGSGIGGPTGDLDRGYANQHGYQIDMSGKGETGWAYPKQDGTYGWTHGIRSKKMFYEAYEEVKREYKDIVNMSLNGEIGKLY